MSHNPATVAYFNATADGPFDHQRDAYEQGWADGVKDERPRVVADIREHFREIVAEHSAQGNDVVLGVLLAAIRDLSADDLPDLDGAS